MLTSILRICVTRTWTSGRTKQPECSSLLFHGAKIRLQVHQLPDRHRVAEIAHLAAKVGVDMTLFDEIYFKDIRNSVFHADYTLTDTEFRMLDGLYKSTRVTSLTPSRFRSSTRSSGGVSRSTRP
jgi:hypothetical protein